MNRNMISAPSSYEQQHLAIVSETASLAPNREVVSKLVHHFTTYREKTAALPEYNNRKHCSRCKLPKSIIGSATVARPGSRRRDFVCAGCKP